MYLFSIHSGDSAVETIVSYELQTLAGNVAYMQSLYMLSSFRLSVRHTGGSVKTAEVRITQFSPSVNLCRTSYIQIF